MRFHPTRLLARAVQLTHVTAIAFSVMYFFSMALTWAQHDGGEHVYMSDVAAIPFGVFSMMVLPGLLVSAVLFILWMARSYHNVSALGGATAHEPQAMVVRWFIPFINLWAPLQAMREIWTSADPAFDPNISDDVAAATRPWSMWLVDAWWGFWLLSNFLDRLTTRLDAPITEEYFHVEMMPMHLLSAVVWGVAAYLVIRLVGRVTDAQYHQLQQMPDVETQAVARQRWGVISLLLVPFGTTFLFVCGIGTQLELPSVVESILSAFTLLAIVAGLGCGLRANWNNSPKPAAGVLGFYLGILNLIALCLVMLLGSI